jgi:hypothetical protein
MLVYNTRVCAASLVWSWCVQVYIEYIASSSTGRVVLTQDLRTRADSGTQVPGRTAAF